MFFVISAIISLVILVGIFISRGFDKNPFSRLDPKSEKIISFFKFRIKQIVQTTRYILFIVIPRRSEESFAKGKEVAMREYQKRKEMVMGKKDINNTGASFFLKRMKEEMGKTESGKIEDESIVELKD